MSSSGVTISLFHDGSNADHLSLGMGEVSPQVVPKSIDGPLWSPAEPAEHSLMSDVYWKPSDHLVSAADPFDGGVFETVTVADLMNPHTTQALENFDPEMWDANQFVLRNQSTSHREQAKTAKQPKRWTKNEDTALLQVLQEVGQLHFDEHRIWEEVAHRLPGRTAAQCIQRWTMVIQPRHQHQHQQEKQWTKKEDATLTRLVKRHGSQSWPTVAGHLKGRAARQCQVRWDNTLRLMVNTGPWVEDEYRTLSDAHAALGPDWAGIAALLPGRTGQQVKDYFQRNPSEDISISMDDPPAAASCKKAKAKATAPRLRRKRKGNPKLGGGSKMKRLNSVNDDGPADRAVLADIGTNNVGGMVTPDLAVVSVVSDIEFQRLPLTLRTAVPVGELALQGTPPRGRYFIPGNNSMPAGPSRSMPVRRDSRGGMTGDGAMAVRPLAESTVDIISADGIGFGTIDGISPLPLMSAAEPGAGRAIPRFTDTVMQNELDLVRPEARKPPLSSTAPVNIRLRRGLPPLHIVNPEMILRAALSKVGELDGNRSA